MWCGDWSELPQDSIRILGAQKGPVQEQDAKSLLYTLGSHKDRNSHLVRLACLGPYLFGSTFFSKDCEVWARSSGLYFGPSKLVDSNMSAEVREAIMVLDTLAYHISFVLVIWNMSECTPSTTLLMAEKHKTFLTDFDKEAHYSTVRKMVEASDFFRLFRKKLTTSLGEEQILACFMIALKVSLAHCHGALDTMLTYIRWDSQQNLQGSRADELKQCGNRKYKEKAYQEAFVYYTNAIEYMCYSHILYSNRALSALQLQKFKEVELDARRAVILQPNFEKGYFEMAQVYASTEQISRAEKVLEDYIKRCDLMSLKFSRDIQDLLNKLRETGEKTKNGKADTKDNQPASGKPKAKPAVPDLVSDSDSDEATPPPKQSKPPTNQKKRTPFDTDKEMKDILKKSCEDLVGGLYQVALQGFKKVLSQKPNLTELDVVLVEYAAGCALLGMGSLEDLKNSVEYFLGIVSNHKDIVFPLAYYGVSRALIKMNRFSEALPHIEKCLSILQKGIQFSEALLWPETKTKVDNAKRPQLQKAMEEMQVLCRAPPKWDAMCCYEACPLQKSIYYSDPDFKGFQQVHCASKCLVQYHPACWREYRESRNLTEKGFLGEACPTPDCCSAVVKVEAIEKDGTVGKQFVHNQLLVETAPKQKKTKKEKKLEQREQKKQQRRAADPGTKQPTNDKDEDAALLQSSASCESTGAAVEDMLKEPSVERAKPPKVQPKPPSEQAAPATSEQAEAADPVQRDAQYVLKKDEDIDEDIQVDGRAKKWKRKKNKPIRVLELEPSDNLYSEYQERIRRLAEYKNLVEEHGYWKDFCHKQKDMIPELDPENPFYIPEGLRRNEAALEAVLQHHGGDHTEESSDINETIYQLFEDLIESKGPLSIHDKLLASEVMNFPEPAQRTVARGGGLQSFLLRSLRFTFDGDMVYTMRMRPWRPSSHKSDEISLPDDGSDYEDDDEFVESDEEEERGAEVANEYDSSRYIETMRQVNSTPSASVASGDSTPNPSTALMKAIANCNLNPNATAFELPLDNLATGSQSGDAQLPSSSTIEKRALPSAAATATRTDTGREVVVQKILSELPPKQLGESLILAVNSFRGPLSSETLASINSGLEHCKLCNKTGMQDLCVQVDQSAEYLEERDALLERCEMLTYENARIKEQYESALDCNMQTNSKHTVETSKYKEKIEELNKELQASRQAAKKNKLESDAEIKKLQQERVKLKEENKLLKTSRNEDDIKETLEKTITEFTKMKSKCDELEETCMALEEASDRALERAKRAEIRILETAHKWGLERFEQSKKLVQKVLKEMEGLKASLDPNSLAELVRKERLADLYMKEWKKEYEQFQRKVQDHIEKVEKGQALADLEVIDLPAKPDFEIPLPKPSVLPLSRLQAPRPQSPRPQTPRPTFPPQQDISMAVKPRMPSFPAQAPLFSHPSGVMLPFTVPAPGPKALPPGLDIPAGAQALSSSATAKPVNIAAIGTPAGPGVTYYFATSAPMPTGNGEVALGAATPARTSPGYPTAASRPAEKAVNEAPGQLHRSEKLMQKLMEKHPGVPREEIRAVLKRIYQTKGFKGLTIADIIKETSVVLHNTFPHAQAASIEGREEHKLPARAPQQLNLLSEVKLNIALLVAIKMMTGVRNDVKPKPRPVLTALRPSQSAVLQPQRPLPVAPPPKTWTSQHEAGQTWSGRSTQCSICLEDLNADRQEIRALRCRHCFHEQCLKEWFKTERTCPNCRSYTLTDSEFPTLGS